MRRASSFAAADLARSQGVSLNRWLTRERSLAWCEVLLALELAGFAFLIAGTYGLIVPLPEPTTTDFVSFYAAGHLADAGVPALAYNQAVHRAAEEAARGVGIRYFYFYYPPVFLLVCAPLARLPYLAAFLVFQAATLVPLVLAIRRVLGLRGWGRQTWLALLPFLAFPAMLVNLGTGQNAFLSGGLFAWGMLLLPAWPLTAGLVLGALCFKPHFGLLLPIALIAGSNGRAFFGAALSVCAWIALSVAAFGLAPWLAYAAALPAMPSVYDSGVVLFETMVSPLAAARVLGLSPASGHMVQAVAALAAVAAVAWVWRKGGPLPLRAATLLAGTLLMAPLILYYDLVLAVVAIAFLVRHAREAGWLPFEKAVFGVIVLVSLLTRSVVAGFGVPLGPLPALLLLGLCLVHAQSGGTAPDQNRK